MAGWEADDIDAAVAVLVDRGVTFNRYDGMEQRANGVWQAPSGDLVAWFTDPERQHPVTDDLFAGIGASVSRRPAPADGGVRIRV